MGNGGDAEAKDARAFELRCVANFRVAVALFALATHHHIPPDCVVPLHRRPPRPSTSPRRPTRPTLTSFTASQWIRLWTRSVPTLRETTRHAFSTKPQIISTRPKGVRRGAPRRAGAKAVVLGSPTAAPATRARAAATVAGGKAAPATAAQQQPADKIIVSNLPLDVNELQVKVRLRCARHCPVEQGLIGHPI